MTSSEAFLIFKRPSRLFKSPLSVANDDAEAFSDIDWDSSTPAKFVELIDCFWQLTNDALLYLLPHFLQVLESRSAERLSAEMMDAIIFKLAFGPDSREIASLLNAAQRQYLLSTIERIEREAFTASTQNSALDLEKIFEAVAPCADLDRDPAG